MYFAVYREGTENIAEIWIPEVKTEIEEHIGNDDEQLQCHQPKNEELQFIERDELQLNNKQPMDDNISTVERTTLNIEFTANPSNVPAKITNLCCICFKLIESFVRLDNQNAAEVHHMYEQITNSKVHKLPE